MERKYGRLRRIGNMVRAFCALLCMLLLGSAHIGEVQTSIWDKETQEKCTEAGIAIL